MASLTEEQKRRMEENKLKALAKRAQRLSAASSYGNNTVSVPVPTAATTHALQSKQQSNNLPGSSLKQTGIVLASKVSSVYRPASVSSNIDSSSAKRLNQQSVQERSAVRVPNFQKPNSSNTNQKHCKEPLSSIYQSGVHSIASKRVGVQTTICHQTICPSVKGVCSLISAERFEIVMPFHQKSIEIFKLIANRMYDPNSKRWTFSIANHNELIEQFKTLKPDAVLEPLPKFVVDMLLQKKEEEKMSSIDLNVSGIDKELVNALMPFQHDGVCFGIQRHGSLLLADDMGLGKTVQALGIASYFKCDWPLLVVCPSSMKYTWVEAFSRWLPSVNPRSVNVIETSKDILTGQVLILSYDLMSRRAKELISKSFRAVIFDESHFLKNSKSARTKVAMEISKFAKRVLMLSGTPALSRPCELFTQIKAVDCKLFKNFHDFGVRYCAAKKNPWGWDYTGASNMKELHLILEGKVMLRRLKKDVISQLPSKQRSMVILDPGLVRTNLTDLKKAAKEMGKENLKGMERRGALLSFFAETAKAKAVAVKEYVLDVLEGGSKQIVFAHHKLMLDSLTDALKEKHHKFIRIDGSTSAEERKRLCDKFQTNDQYSVALLSITAANAGITLTAAALVLFVELYWNPGILTQAEDRAHRIGQQDCVDVRYLVAKVSFFRFIHILGVFLIVSNPFAN